MVSDGYDYFSDANIGLELSTGKTQQKYLTADNYLIPDKVLQTVSRDRLVQRQTYSQTKRLDNPNEPIRMNNGDVDQIIIGFQEGGFGDGS